MEIMSRSQALRLGLKRYLTGEPCKYGHISQRLVNSSHCCECLKIRGKVWTQNNRERSRELDSRWRKANPDKVRKRLQNWHENNPEYKYNYMKEYMPKYRKANPEKVRQNGRNQYAADPEKFKAKWKLWATVTNPARAKMLNVIKSERTKQATPAWVNREAIYEIYMNCPNGYHVDHIVPIKGITPDGYDVCGINYELNLQCLPAKENLEKHSRMTQRCYEIACSLKHNLP